MNRKIESKNAAQLTQDRDSLRRLQEDLRVSRGDKLVVDAKTDVAEEDGGNGGESVGEKDRQLPSAA